MHSDRGSTRATARFIHPHDDVARLGSQSPDPILLRESGSEYEHHSRPRRREQATSVPRFTAVVRSQREKARASSGFYSKLLGLKNISPPALHHCRVSRDRCSHHARYLVHRWWRTTSRAAPVQRASELLLRPTHLSPDLSVDRSSFSSRQPAHYGHGSSFAAADI